MTRHRSQTEPLWGNGAAQSAGLPHLLLVKRESAGSSDHGVGFVFNAKDQDSFDSVHIFHHDAAQAPLGWEQDDGHLMSAVAASTNTGNIPALTSSDTLWVQVNNDGTNVTVKLATSKAGLATAGVSFTSSAYDGSGTPSGQVGFVTTGSLGQIISIGDFELSADRDNNGSYETLEHVDDFAIDSGGQAEETLTHDAAGNLTYDGVYAYSYDAWNRLTKMHKAFRNPASPSTVTNASLITQNTYNGAGRRIAKTITNAGYLNETYSYFYTPGWQLIETRNGSGQVIKQHVWGAQYIDEIVQITINGDPVDDPEFDTEDPDHDFRGYWAMQDSNFNVLGIADGSGTLVERYEYTPYGKRTVYHAPGSNDEQVVSPSPQSRRVTASGLLQPYGINEVGHQGLIHEEEVSIVHNRERCLHINTGRFMQRDPVIYADGMNIFQYARSNPVNFSDWRGYAARRDPNYLYKVRISDRIHSTREVKRVVASSRSYDYEQKHLSRETHPGSGCCTHPTFTDKYEKIKYMFQYYDLYYKRYNIEKFNPSKAELADDLNNISLVLGGVSVVGTVASFTPAAPVAAPVATTTGVGSTIAAGGSKFVEEQLVWQVIAVAEEKKPYLRKNTRLVQGEYHEEFVFGGLKFSEPYPCDGGLSDQEYADGMARWMNRYKNTQNYNESKGWR